MFVFLNVFLCFLELAFIIYAHHGNVFDQILWKPSINWKNATHLIKNEEKLFWRVQHAVSEMNGNCLKIYSLNLTIWFHNFPALLPLPGFLALSCTVPCWRPPLYLSWAIGASFGLYTACFSVWKLELSFHQPLKFWDRWRILLKSSVGGHFYIWGIELNLAQ